MQHWRDFTAELTEVLVLKDPSFMPHQLDLWTENVEAKAAPVESSFQAVDEEINKLDHSAKESAFRQDCLRLCPAWAALQKRSATRESAPASACDPPQKSEHYRCQLHSGLHLSQRKACSWPGWGAGGCFGRGKYLETPAPVNLVRHLWQTTGYQQA